MLGGGTKREGDGYFIAPSSTQSSKKIIVILLQVFKAIRGQWVVSARLL